MFEKFGRLSKLRVILAIAVTVISLMIPFLVSGAAGADGGQYEPALYATFWSLVPPLVAIILALITKEVFSSLFLGVLIGGIFFAIGNGGPAVYDDAGEAVWESSNAFSGTFNHIVKDGFLASLTDGWNVGILIFLAILGIMVVLMSKVGGARAFGDWATKKIKTRVGAQISLMVFHLFIFIDDYFACLTVGTVMRPVMDKAKVSRAKLAYLIDATAAPICILAPISTWAAAVASYVPEGSNVNGFSMFIQAIPYNFYAILTIVMILCLVIMKFDFGPMGKHEYNAEFNNDLFTTKDETEKAEEADLGHENGKVYDLAIPIIILIISCVLSLIYTGGFFDKNGDNPGNFVDSFANADAATGLVIGSLFAIVLTILYYICRGLVKIRDLTDVVPKGLNAMSSPILILTFAWTLKNMTDALGSTDFVSNAMQGPAQSLEAFLPAIVFIVSGLIAFSTGTSWGTYGIMVPIVVSVFEGVDPALLTIGVAACLAGGVLGDHCSPISDTTIMASAGARCNHINHVNTQLPYALTVAVFSFVMYLVAGFVKNPIVLPIAIVIFIGLMIALKKMFGNKKNIENS